MHLSMYIYTYIYILTCNGSVCCRHPSTPFSHHWATCHDLGTLQLLPRLLPHFEDLVLVGEVDEDKLDESPNIPLHSYISTRFLAIFWGIPGITALT